MPDQDKHPCLAAVARRGDHAATLRALRNKLAAEIDGCDTPRDVAVLSARFAEVLTQIEAIKTPRTSKRDELARKRASRQRAAAARLPDAADSGGPARGNKRGR